MTDTTARQGKAYRQLIAGEWVDGSEGQTYPDMNPFNGEVFAQMPASSRADARRAIEAAHKAFPAWAAMGARARQALFLEAADILERRANEIVAIMAQETGSANPFSRFQVQWACGLLRQAAGYPYLPGGEIVQSDTPGVFAMAIRRPLGVVAGISPWNGSLALGFRTVVAPLACGNTVVLKPSEDAPVCAGLLMGEIMTEAGFPAGVLNVITHAPGQVGPIADELFENRKVRAYNFTGSSATGAMLAARAGKHLKRIALELGGYNPMLVLADADLDYSVDTAIFAAFFHQGQICMNTRKILVARPLYDEFLQRFVERAKGIQAGDPMDP
jgi:acyl-CoA reductase-like NAD-dependent aldehyde dehydrogenase